MNSRLLLVDDDTRLATMVGDYLGAAGFETEHAGSLAAGRERLAASSYDALVLDLMLPDGDGLDLCRELRANPRTRHLPLLMLTARGEPLDRIVGLELGADDYIVKPYELRELLARVRSVLRRLPPPGAAPATPDNDQPSENGRRIVSFGGFSADLDGRVVTGPDGAPVDMAKSEFDVLEVFLTRANRVLTRSTIAEAVGFGDESEDSRALDIRIMRLRKKIEPDPASPRFLRTVRGEGYVFSLAEPSGPRAN